MTVGGKRRYGFVRILQVMYAYGIHPAVNYVIVSYVIVNGVIEHRCRLVVVSDSDNDTDILAIYCYLYKKNFISFTNVKAHNE